MLAHLPMMRSLRVGDDGQWAACQLSRHSRRLHQPPVALISCNFCFVFCPTK